MKFSTRLAMTVASLSLMGVSAVKADTILQYTIDPGSYFDLSGFSIPLTGGFTYDATTDTFSNVTYNRSSDTFTTASSSGPGATGGPEIFFGDTGSSDYDVLQLQNSLALGGTDTIVSGTHPAIYVSAGGSITASTATAVPEPATWALTLIGFGLMGAALRGRKLGVATR